MSKQRAALQLSMWLAKTHPELFSQLARAAHGTSAAHGTVGELGQVDIPPPDLSAVSMADVTNVTLPDVTEPSSSIFSSIGSGIASAVTSVGSALTNPTVLNSFANVAANYYKAQAATASQSAAQTAVLNTQIARARAGLSPAPIAYTPNGAPVYVPTAGTPIPGAIAQAPTYGTPNSPLFGYGVTSNGLAALQPSFIDQYGMWLLIGGGLLAVGLLLTRNRK